MEHAVTTQRLADLLRSAMSPLVPLLDDPQILHISVSHTGAIWAERFGCGAYDTQTRLTPAQAEQAIRLIATHVGQVATRQHSRLQAVLPSGERAQCFLPPTVPAPALEIRKRPARIYTLEEYVAAGIVTAPQAGVMRAAVRDRNNIVVAGGTGSGKTTLLNALLDLLRDEASHIVTVEDTAELQCAAPYYLALYTIPGVTTLTHLVSDALRCSPSRVIIGEVRGAEALDFLDLLNTGHPGGMLSLHADPGKALWRLESLIRRAPLTVPLPLEEMRRLIAEAIDVIIDIVRVPGAPGRLVHGITACRGLDAQGQYRIDPLVVPDHGPLEEESL